MTLTVECAFRLRPCGVEFRLDDDPPEDEMCELRVRFNFNRVYAPERDVGAGLSWLSCLPNIDIRTPGDPWQPVLWPVYAAAHTFLETHCSKALDQAEREAAVETYYGS